MLICLYQLADLNSPMAFKQWDDSLIGSIDLSNYKRVYRFWYKTKPPKDSDYYDSVLDNRDENTLLKVVQNMFYPTVPANCVGHALSTSDIITIDDTIRNTKTMYYYSKGAWIDISEVIDFESLGNC